MYVIIGANGFLGAYLIKNILDTTEERILAVSRKFDGLMENKRVEKLKCDISEQSDLKCLRERMKQTEHCKVICLAAYHNPDLVSKNPRFAWNTNISSLAYLLNILENIECFFYSSTDSVYGQGSIEYYFKEDEPLKPVNLYGAQKALAEKIVIAYGYNVVRYPFLIGPSLLSNRFHFYDTIVNSILNGHPVQMYKDSIRSSLDFNQAAALLIDLIEHVDRPFPDIINIAGDNALSKYDVGLMIAEKYGVLTELIQPVSVSDSSQIFETPRPEITLLNNTLLKHLLGLNEIKIKI